jgi:hypothetical protein
MLPDLNLTVAFSADQLLELFPAPLTYQYATLVISIPAFSCNYIGFRLNITDYDAGVLKKLFN